MPPEVARFMSKVKKVSSGCWEWQAGILFGYGRFWLNGREIKAHRASHQFFIGEIPAGLSVCHTCDNRSCVNPDHFFLGTALDNARDRESKGRGGREKRVGDKNPNSKISNNDAIIIRDCYTKGMNQKEIAAKFGLGQPAISRIINHKRYAVV